MLSGWSQPAPGSQFDRPQLHQHCLSPHRSAWPGQAGPSHLGRAIWAAATSHRPAALSGAPTRISATAAVPGSHLRHWGWAEAVSPRSAPPARSEQSTCRRVNGGAAQRQERTCPRPEPAPDGQRSRSSQRADLLPGAGPVGAPYTASAAPRQDAARPLHLPEPPPAAPGQAAPAPGGPDGSQRLRGLRTSGPSGPASRCAAGGRLRRRACGPVRSSGPAVRTPKFPGRVGPNTLQDWRA